MNFEDCKKIMLQYLEAKEAIRKLKEKCETCDYCTAYCNECPFSTEDGQCKWPE